MPVTIASRLHELGTKLYGPGDYLATKRTIATILRKIWAADTARPSLADRWSPSQAALGQDDVTSCYLCTFVYGGTIVLYRLVNGQLHHLIWSPNGEGTSNQDFCQPHDRFAEVLRSFSPPDFLVEACANDPSFDGRLRTFTSRFEAALVELEHEADKP